MSDKPDGGPAFPTPRYERGEMFSLGMTLRDYFAAKALVVAWQAFDQGYTAQDDFDSHALAKHAYVVADAMLAARGKA